MALRVITDPFTTFRALTISVPKLTSLALPRWLAPAPEERSGVAGVTAPISTRLNTLQAACRGTLPWLDAGECPRVDVNVRIFSTALEPNVHLAPTATAFKSDDSSRVLDVAQLKYNTIPNAENVSTAHLCLIDLVLRAPYVLGRSGA